jgi:hypothetical protein
MITRKVSELRACVMSRKHHLPIVWRRSVVQYKHETAAVPSARRALDVSLACDAGWTARQMSGHTTAVAAAYQQRSLIPILPAHGPAVHLSNHLIMKGPYHTSHLTHGIVQQNYSRIEGGGAGDEIQSRSGEASRPHPRKFRSCVMALLASQRSLMDSVPLHFLSSCYCTLGHMCRDIHILSFCLIWLNALRTSCWKS